MMQLIGSAIFVLVCVTPVLADEMTNLIPNSSFEIDDDGDGMPDGWRFDWKYTHNDDREQGREKQKPRAGWDNKVVHSGGRSLYVANERPEDDGVWTMSDMPVGQGVRYVKLQAWMKTENFHATDAKVAGVFLGKEGKWLGADYSTIAVNVNRDWTRYTGYLQLPQGTTKLRIRLWLNMNYTGTGSVWFDDLSLVAIDSMVTPVQRYEDDRPVPAWSEEQKAVGYVCYARDYLRLIFPTSQPSPSEINAPLSCFAAPGEQEPVAFVVRSIRELEDVRVSCSALTSDKQTLLGSDHLLVRSVRYGKKKGQSRWGMFQTDEMVVPLYLSSVNRIHIPPETSQQYWITVRVPRDTVPGRYRGTVTIAAANAKETRLPLEVDVLPFQLREPDHIYWGMYHRPVGDEEFRIGAWRDMREHGMNSVGLCCNLGAQLALEGGKVSLTFDGTGELERSVREYQQAGFVMPIAWLMGSDVMRWCQAQAEGDEQKFADYYRQIIVALLAQGERNRWPEIIIQPIDEPFEHTSRLDEAERCLRILKTVPELRTEEDGPNGNPGTLERLYDLCDVLVYHDGPVLRRGVYDAVGWGAFLRRLRHDGKEVWFYNMDLTGWHPEVLRFGYGFGLSQAGGTGAIQWSYQIAFQPDKPRLVYDKTDSIIYQYPQAGDETGGPTLAWEASREGVDDYKYLYTLEQLVKEMSARDTAQARRGRLMWQDISKHLKQIDFRGSTGSAAQGDWTGRKEISPDGDKIVSGEFKMANNLDFHDYDALRRKIADAIIGLTRK